jgi:hypothetical protein
MYLLKLYLVDFTENNIQNSWIMIWLQLATNTYLSLQHAISFIQCTPFLHYTPNPFTQQRRYYSMPLWYQAKLSFKAFLDVQTFLNWMDSSKPCMTCEHHLKLQQNWMRKWCANESLIEYECWLDKQNNYARKKYVEKSLAT